MYGKYGSVAHSDNSVALNDSQPYLQSHSPPLFHNLEKCGMATPLYYKLERFPPTLTRAYSILYRSGRFLRL